MSRFFFALQRLPGKATVVLVLAVWLLAHPYVGIFHDGVLYAGQALAMVYPDIYRNDLFIQFGYQGGFTLFTRGYASLIQWMGLSPATKLLTFAVQISYALALIALLRRYGAAVLVITVCLIMALPMHYGGWHIFVVGEGFLTARPIAEFLVIFGIGALLARKIWVASVLMLAAATMHPLMALPGLILCHLLIATWLPWRKRLLWLLLPVLALSALILAHKPPFDHPLLQYDHDWLLATQMSNAAVFLANWPEHDWMRVCWQLLTLGLSLALPGMDETFRRMIKVYLPVCVLALLAAYLATDLFHNVLLTSLQLWRATWLAQLLAVVALACMFAHDGPARVQWQLTALLLVFAAFLIWSVYYFYPVMVLAVALALWPRPVRFPPRVAFALTALLAFCVLCGYVAGLSAQSANMLAIFNQAYFKYFTAFSGASLAALVLLGMLPLLLARRKGLRYLMLSLLVCISLTAWDHRPPWIRVADTAAGNNPFDRLVPHHATVYWATATPLTWLTMNRSGYALGHTAAATLFSRDFAMGSTPRLRLAQDFETPYRECLDKAAETGQRCVFNQKILDDFCHADSTLDFVITEAKTTRAPLQSWQIPLPGRIKEQYLYACKQ
ncbi:hypothetical protein SAMN02745857_04153 [Andreprevotia lacus DSM 23236]|jgi:hypothetical protein|uniref:Uncharacterized protein n=1 Tax=Andreprevotia lacus DSM 23236 TaxID=1121001 RepID=A0A1W1Y0Z4_9NEIS|nr:hypothetical protein [Andreprevotia lacus]SMC29812.1 hypothetical protein SAMN02745857_04153 [Andreprevotia lacus DSM 23236]